MKLFSKRNIFIKILLILFVIVTLLLLQNRNINYLREKILEKTKGLPKSYDECEERRFKSFKERQQKSPSYSCSYYVIKSNSLYEECVKFGGSKQQQSCMLDGSKCDPSIFYCIMKYINPNYTLPKTYDECRNIFNGYGNGTDEKGDWCSSFINKEGFINKEVGDKLYNECVERGGEVSEHTKYCEWKAYR